MSITRRIADASALVRPPLAAIVAKGATGGQGATTFSICLADQFDLHECPLSLIQIDEQQRLQRTFGRDVCAIDTQLMRARRDDPAAATRAFAPLYDHVIAIRDNNTSALIDCGALQSSHLFAFSRVSELSDELRDLKISIVIFVVALAAAESLRQAAVTLREAHSTFPLARLAMIENRRDGSFDDLPAGSDAARVYETELMPLLRNVDRIVMPLIPAGSWQHFERSHHRFIDAIAMPVDDIVAATGLPRSEAKIARGDVAAWFQAMEIEVGRVLRFEGDNNG